MAARSVRRRFANPFVITLAAVPACVVQSSPAPSGRTQQPPPAETANTPPPANNDQIVVANPPRPTTGEPATAPPPSGPKSGTAQTYDQRWTVMNNGGTCRAYINVNCPTAAPGKPQPTCNPPPPRAYTCPDGLAENGTLKIVQLANQTTCQTDVDLAGFKCPPNTHCNPPRPRTVDCPQ